jgi:pimeloyl-ACP methyl ester carboxylesterase
LPNPRFPSFISAGTLVDQADTPAYLLDFFGAERQDGGVSRISCPLLVFFGTRGDVGDATDLALVESAPARLSRPELRVETALIDGADHMYTGEERQVAQVIDGWIRATVLPATP